MNVGIIGAGAWGSALAINATRSNCDVILWAYNGEYRLFDGVEIPKNIKICQDLADLKICDIWLIVTPAAFFRETIRNASKFYNKQPVIICTKGAEIQQDNLYFMSEILRQELPQCQNFGTLAGPQFAQEVAMDVPTGSTLATNSDFAQKMGTDALNHIYLSHSTDIIGTEICSVGKNAVALICGYMKISSRGENERALIFTRAWNEVIKIGLAMGGQIQSFLDFCGIGDLFLTATSETSRNFSAGLSIAKHESVTDSTVEGISALKALVHRAQQLSIETPVLSNMKKIMNI